MYLSRIAKGLAIAGLFVVGAAMGGVGFGCAAKGVRVDDAFVSSDRGGSRWSIGTDAVEMSFALDDGRLKLMSCLNRLTTPAREYIGAQAAVDLLPSENAVFPDIYRVEQVWSKVLTSGVSADPSADDLRLTVKKGDTIGFALSRRDNIGVDWVTRVDYGDGDTYTSSDDTSLDQGPVWYYFLHVGGTGFLEPMSSTAGDGDSKTRVPQGGTYYAPAWSGRPSVSGKMLSSTDYQAVRAWRAPKDGVVSIHGVAKGRGGGSVEVRVLRIADKVGGSRSTDAAGTRWRSEGASGKRVTVGGRPAAQLDWTLASTEVEGLRVVLHVQAHPGTSILRHWVEVKNSGSKPVKPGFLPQLFSMGLRDDGLVHHWMIGGNNADDQGMLKSAEVGSSYHQAVGSHGQWRYTPWMAVQRKDGDGLFVELDYTGMWRLAVDREHGGPTTFTAGVPDTQFAKEIEPGEQLTLPMVALGVFRDDLDDMGRRIYDWQYMYLWDYTHHAWYGKMLYACPIFSMNTGTASNQENFAVRLEQDIFYADLARSMGFEILWDDAGWSARPGFWNTDGEAPDFAETVRYTAKSGMKWALWFLGQPSQKLLDTKVGSWGNFQWRTDGVASYALDDEAKFRSNVQGFRDRHPRASFHTCGGGGTYAHTFEIQRFADTNYFADSGGDQTNHYFSYFEPPDKWFDNLVQRREYPEKAQRILTMVPVWGAGGPNGDATDLGPVADIYRYLTANGVAGRWSYVAHPVIKGDVDHQYFQRVSRDQTKSVIIIKHKPKGEVTVYPRGLIADHSYLVEFGNKPAGKNRNGADLMANGMTLRDVERAECIFLNLPNRPGGGKDKTAPLAPGRALSRTEENLGYGGIGIYWSPGSDDNWVSRYEVRRDDRIIDTVAQGTYTFDRSEGWDSGAEYSVRTVDGDDNVSAWTAASTTVQDAPAYSALGGHSSRSGFNGWKAEVSSDGRNFAEMTWIPKGELFPVWIDVSKQPGGAEGYWQAAETARVGHAWQQASTTAECVRTWVAPRAGTVRVVGRAMKDHYHQEKGEQLRVRILLNDAQIWPDGAWAAVPQGIGGEPTPAVAVEARDTIAVPTLDAEGNYGDAGLRSGVIGVAHDLVLDVEAGDAFRFVLARGTTPDHDYVAWMPKISYQGTGRRSGDASVVRIACGSSREYTDSCGNVWSSDDYFSDGSAMSSAAAVEEATPGVADQALYRSGRSGKDFSYSIPVKPGLYTLRLKFVEPKYPMIYERPFNLSINGRSMLRNFDICQAAHGANKAYEQVFRYLVPDADGNIVLRFTGGWDPAQKSDEAIVQAIEVMPEIKPAVRIDVGSDRKFVDWISSMWSADFGFDGGVSIASSAKVSQASPTLYDQELYRTARSGKSLAYKLSVAPGLYTVHLKFAELWLKEKGKRPLNIEVNDRRVREAWDPAQAAGELGVAADFRVEDVAPDKDGNIRIIVSAAGENDAILQGIVIE